MVHVGINGFGRIGKSIFIQILQQSQLKVVAINIPNFDINNIETYLNYDSCHQYHSISNIKVIDQEYFCIGNHKIRVFNHRDAREINWKKYNIDYVIDSTGAYLTTEKVKLHNVNYVIMCAPPKDETPQFIVNGNHDLYQGEQYISNSSCTTNSIVPVLKFLEDHYQIESANFTTIHATTASQTTIDTNHLDKRTHRSIYNNIIPHTTGASKSITKIIPSLEGKVFGTSLRVPVINVSLIDLNVKLTKKTDLQTLLKHFQESNYIQISSGKHLVSSDFNTSTCPSIIDSNACMSLPNNEFKLMIWYDNEWSYSHKVIKLVSYISKYNFEKQQCSHPMFIENLSYLNKRVVLRVDWNVPFNSNLRITDDYRIKSSLKTIQYLLSQNPKYIMIVSHLGRPKNKEPSLSWKNFMSHLQTYFESSLVFLPDLTSKDTQHLLSQPDNKLFILENIRFFQSETNYSLDNPSTELSKYLQLGDIYVNDAFGCCHRNHMSITSFKNKPKSFGYLINQEIQHLDLITNNQSNQKILAIIGGGKMDDKLPLLENLSKKVDSIYIAGGNINSIRTNMVYQKYLETISYNKASIYKMSDGLAALDLESTPTMMNTNTIQNLINFFDIGMNSIIELNELVSKHDIIFWNGPLGVIEHHHYNYGSKTLFEILKKSGKKIIIGGGDTAGFVNQYQHQFHYISTGGGASLDYISNGHLLGYDVFNTNCLSN